MMEETEKPIFFGGEILQRFETDLINEGLLTSDQLNVAHISKDNLGIDLGSVLIKKGFVSENTLLQFVSHRLNIPFISLKTVNIDTELMHKLPQHLARKYHALPIGKKDNVIVVAMANPFDNFALEDIKEFLHSEISPCLVNQKEIEEILNQSAIGSSEIEEKILTVDVSSDINNGGEEDRRKMEAMASGPQVVAAVNSIIARASSEGASDIHIEPIRKHVNIRFRVDGLLRERGMLVKNMQLPVVSRIKILAGLDIAERRIPQDGRVRIRLVGKPLDLRISTCPTQFGEKVVMRLLAKDGVRTIESLGFSEKERKLFSEIISKSHGIFLATGPTGSGKSTTLYAALDRLNSSEKNIISIEDPIENEIDGINQVAVNSKVGLSFATVLRSVLRQDPDVIMIGEIRDAETAQIAVRAAITGHMVLSTLHTNTATGAISRLMDLGVEPFLLSSALKGVLAQRLVRRVCETCKEEISLSQVKLPEWAKNIQKMYRGKGCKTCNFTGYKGRKSIFELAPITEEVCKMISARTPDVSIAEYFRSIGVKSILDDGAEKIEAGITTLEEVMRVTEDE